MNYKTCTNPKCGESFPATLEFFNANKSYKDGFRGWCKGCCRKYDREYRKNNKKIIDQQNREWRKNNPEKVRQYDREYRKNNPEKIKQRHRDYRKNNHEKVKQYTREYYENNLEKIKRRNRKYRESNPEKVRQQKRKYCEANPEKERQQGRDWRKNNPEYAREWAKNNPDKIGVYKAKRRALKLNQTPDLTETEDKRIRLIYKKCKELGSGWHVDHIRPISKGGLHHPDNLQIVTKSYNLEKGSKLDFRSPTDTELNKN